MRTDTALVLAARMLCGTADEVQLRRAAADVSDWPALVSSAQVENLAPVLYSTLRRCGSFDGLPADARRELESEYWNSAARSVVLDGELAAILTALERDGIDPIVLKGAALTGTVYKDPALRPMSDIDLLVRAEEFSRACERLRSDTEYGDRVDMDPAYMQLTHAVFYGGPPKKITLEVHKSLLGDVSLRNEESVWSETVREGRRRVLRPEFMLAHLCAHSALRHQLRSLSQLLDIALVIRAHPHLDWQALESGSVSLGVASAARDALDAVSRTLGVAIPHDVMERLASARDGSVRTFAMSLVSHGGKRNALRVMGRLCLQSGWRKKLAYAKWNLFPSPGWVCRSVGVRKALVYPYYLYRVLRAGVALAGHIGRRIAGRASFCR